MIKKEVIYYVLSYLSGVINKYGITLQEIIENYTEVNPCRWDFFDHSHKIKIIQNIHVLSNNFQ